MMNDMRCIQDLEVIKECFKTGTNGSYPESIDYAINRIKSLNSIPAAENLSREKAIKELEFLMEAYRQLLDCGRPEKRYEDLYDACKMGRDALKAEVNK